MLLKNQSAFIYLFFLLLSSLSKVYSQDQNGMLMYQIENKQFKKTSFDKNGKMISYQYIKVGKLIKNNEVFSLEIKMKSYNKNGILKKEETSKYNCKTKEGNIFMGVFPFINKPSKKIDIIVLSKNYLYPTNFTGLKALDDYKLSVSYKTGMLGISTKINMNYTNRSVKKIGNNIIIITGKIEIKIFVAGVNVSNPNYKSEEKMDVSKGVIYQRFVDNTGAYFKIQLLNK